MAEFQNTIDILGDEIVAASIVERSITVFNDDLLYEIGRYAFRDCQALTSVDLPNVTSIDQFAFQNCPELTSVDLRNATSIGYSSFTDCSNLNVIILGGQSVCTLANTNAFGNTPFAAGKAGGTVYVWREFIEQYQNATNWSTLYAAGTCNFVAIEGSEYE